METKHRRRGRRVQRRVTGEREAVHPALAKPFGDVGVAVLVRVAEREHAAGLSSLIEQTDEHVSILAHRNVAHRAGALGEDDRAEAGAQAFVAAPTLTMMLPRRSIAIVCDGGCRAGSPTTIVSIRFRGISESVR